MLDWGGASDQREQRHGQMSMMTASRWTLLAGDMQTKGVERVRPI